MINCCYHCTTRTATCHATCKIYADELAQHKKQKQATSEQAEIDGFIACVKKRVSTASAVNLARGGVWSGKE